MSFPYLPDNLIRRMVVVSDLIHEAKLFVAAKVSEYSLKFIFTCLRFPRFDADAIGDTIGDSRCSDDIIIKKRETYYFRQSSVFSRRDVTVSLSVIKGNFNSDQQ